MTQLIRLYLRNSINLQKKVVQILLISHLNTAMISVPSKRIWKFQR
uniref:Uncharacterized protein n=1 Tax=Rhizophora mucronata TaxID=61149 RepID=A0A2P2J8H7_RHIMU